MELDNHKLLILVHGWLKGNFKSLYLVDNKVGGKGMIRRQGSVVPSIISI